jgi:hypothetical protein
MTILPETKTPQPQFCRDKRRLFPWVRMAFIHPIGEMLELAAGKSTKHPNLIAWYERIGQREAVQRGLLIPETNPPEVQMEIFINAVLGLGELHK